MTKISIDAIDQVLSNISNTVNYAELAGVLGTSIENAQDEFSMAVGEARQTLTLLSDFKLGPETRVLEVGAGLGLASLALSQLGVNTTGIEPGGIGFESNQNSSSYLSKHFGSSTSIISATAEEVTFPEEVQFDVIYSNNVLEHVNDFDVALINLLKYLSSTGVMIHSCPNYTFPFEPHFGIPLVPIAPRFTKQIFRKKLSHSGLWESLNFITAFKLKRSLRKTEFKVLFRKGTMTRSFSRLTSDVEFQKRHPLLGRIARNPLAFRVMKRLLSLPYWLATPMDFIVVHESQSRESRVLNWLNAN